MTRSIRPISRTPLTAESSIPLNNKLEFAADIVEIVIPLIQNKDPENPNPPSGNTSTTSSSL